jgi:hypothetical protein
MDDKKCILELKEVHFQWRQMEWIGFYFEWLSKNLLADSFTVPGDKYGNVAFDCKGAINWDFKTKAIKSDSHVCILNDKEAMDRSIAEYGYHGEIIALCDVNYNDTDRSFQKWHTELKGGKSEYEKEREKRTVISRFRKTEALLSEILVLTISENDVDYLSMHHQGRNSNGSPRKVKYQINIENLGNIGFYSITLGGEDVLQ